LLLPENKSKSGKKKEERREKSFANIVVNSWAYIFSFSFLFLQASRDPKPFKAAIRRRYNTAMPIYNLRCGQT
jgi:hypothetical protein